MNSKMEICARRVFMATLFALMTSSLLMPEPVVAQRRGSMAHAGRGGGRDHGRVDQGRDRGGVNRGGVNRGNAQAFRAGKSVGRRQGYNVGVHQGYRAGVHTGYRGGLYRNPWAYRAPTLWVWHPVGFFVATLATTAIVVSVVNSQGQAQSSGNVYYDQGVYYEKTSDGYKAIPPPQGAQISSLPDGYTAVTANNVQYSYYQGDFYVEQDGQYVVTQAPVGATVPYIPDSATESTSGGDTVYEYNGVKYQAVSLNGDTSYIVSSS
jgi:hypothetical protein